jgi:hypothetical protein
MNPIKKFSLRIFPSIVMNVLLLLFIITNFLNIPIALLTEVGMDSSSNKLVVKGVTISAIMTLVAILTLYWGVLIFRMGTELVIDSMNAIDFVKDRYDGNQAFGNGEPENPDRVASTEEEE